MQLSTAISNPLWQSIDKTSLMPLNDSTRQIAVGLYDLVRDQRIISPHGHVDPGMLLRNQPFESATDLFIYHNHYITRLLHADGVAMSEILRPKDLAGEDLEVHARNAWQQFAQRSHLLAGTASGYWFERELVNVFGLDARLTGANAQDMFDEIQGRLATPEMLPQQLFKDFGIELLATTDSPTDTLESHRRLNQLDLGGRIAPTFRPDAFINPSADGWAERVELMIAALGNDVSQQGFIDSLAQYRAHFIACGAFSVDIGTQTAYTTILSDADAQRMFHLALQGKLTPEQARDYRGHMIGEMIRQSCDDGLVITLHVGVVRNHSTQTFSNFGPDTGHDLPIRAEFVKNLHPVLQKYGLNPNLHLVLFSLDESTWARDIAPLASFYPSVFIGAPWWFLDAPNAARRFREAVTDGAGFYRGSGFIDDTRAFLSIPTRHDMSRRVDSAFLAELVSQQRLTIAQAEQIAVDLVTEIPKRAFKL